MKLVNYSLKHPFAANRIGFILYDKIVDLHATYEEMIATDTKLGGTHVTSNPDAFYALGSKGIELAQKVERYVKDKGATNSFSREEVILHTPIPNPSKIICIGTNYADHVAEMKGEIPEFPVLFAKFNNALIGPEDTIQKAKLTEKLDYEVELAVVIGERATNVAEADAFDYIAGYTIGNDISARDLQKRTPQWLQGKSLDKSTPVGPWLVTKDEITDPANLTVRSYVNDELRQSSNTENLIFNIPHLISFISNLITLEPGDIILTGTPDGVGLAMDPPKLLHDGDVVRLEIESIGTLTNTVKDER
ncbi:fumarylacetoacetate hydrolase family protein [Saliterribacillus persicus]|uniref:2-keto-4-pentenoate hydratase/2-oxohepta-3-ene-1,7-dioic acid hydratase in catechol pathway n=1 Tax=Saliterribacillus persicus TaxID=930114 RepID=A0A368YBG4_9BACI|nr:fumarylacetoacetate hydrolase family protein [Saliterribacillus persicus]RCW76768.1 2-keto-4-pentenoate hydratase/2-oxohepta-3-ene-1,7-dioic acid hydratase in catechol pathway [Saliterribacillus persicus]